MADPFSTKTPTLRDVLDYIDQQLARTDDDHEIAYSIAGLYSLSNIDRLRDSDDLDAILGYAGSLEIPGGNEQARAHDWQRLHRAR
jgi:hypothetical protein